MAEDKEHLRREILKRRESLTFDECLEKSRRIKQRLLSLPEYEQATSIMLYMALPKEVQSRDLVEETMARGKRVILPRISPTGDELLLSEVRDLERELVIGRFGILEPGEEFYRPVGIEDLDLIVLPGVAFDLSGHRVGFGKGFYDRLLSRTQRPKTIGLSFELQLVDRIPAAAHDIRVDKIITENRIICCSKSN